MTARARTLAAAVAVLALAGCGGQSSGPPEGFTRLADVAPEIVQEVRYHGEHNFVGRPITGYEAPECWLTEEAAQALAAVQADVTAKGYSLKVYDCYRPQRAVDDFVAWAEDPADLHRADTGHTMLPFEHNDWLVREERAGRAGECWGLDLGIVS